MWKRFKRPKHERNPVNSVNDSDYDVHLRLVI